MALGSITSATTTTKEYKKSLVEAISTVHSVYN
jgi:hypothetical protein